MRAQEFTEPQAAGCIIVARDTGRWCLQQRSDSVSDPGVWSTWGGGRVPGESVSQCVRRELAEESGYQGPVKLELIDSNGTYATFLAHVLHEFEPRLNSESQAYQWSDPDELPKPLHPGLQQTLSQVGINEGKSSFDRCYNQSCRLYDQAEKQGLEPKQIQVAGFLGDGSSADPRWLQLPQQVWKHYVVVVGDTVLDPTADQFGPNMPKKYPVQDLDRLWDQQYQIRPKELEENFADGKVKSQQSVAPGANNITYKQQKSKNKFSVEMLVDGKTAGMFQYDANTGRTITELDPAYRGQGLGQRLILKGIYTAAMLGMDYVEDTSRTAMFDRALDSLADAGFIVSDEEYWYVTDSGEQFLKQSVTENFADGKVKGKSRPGRVKRAGASCKGSVTDLRARAKKASGEKAKMYHWCANMKSGKSKRNK